MSFSSINSAIETHFASHWQNRLPVDYPNLPANHTGNDALWCRFYILLDDGEQKSLGETAVHAWTGIACVQLFAKENTGIQSAIDYAEIIRGIMQRRTLTFDTTGKIYLLTPQIRDIGETPYQFNIITPFRVRQQFTKVADA